MVTCDHEEYWPHCLRCVVGEEPTEVNELEADCFDMCVKVEVVFDDGIKSVLRRHPDGWRFTDHHIPKEARKDWRKV